jgi:hypothetical protein
VSLTGVGTPAPGTPVVGLGSQPVGGRVVSAVINGSQTDLVLEIGDLTSLFKSLKIDVSYTPEQTLRFIQQAPVTASKQSASARPMVGVKDFCKADVESVPLTGDLRLKVDPTLAIDVAADVSALTLKRLLIKAAGTVDVAGKATLTLGAALNGTVTCKLPLSEIVVPIFGAVSLFIAPVIPFEARLKLAATVSSVAFSVGADLKQRSEFAMGLLYTEADGLKRIEELTLHKPELETSMTSPLESTVRAKATAFFGLGSGVALGNIIAALDVLDLNVGPEIEAKFGLPYDAAKDEVYTTGYELKGKVALGPGDQIKEALKKFLGSDKIVSFSVKLVEQSFGKSPQKSSLVADKDQYQAGQTVTFDLKLDPAYVSFPVLGYNVGELQVRRLDRATLTSVLIGTLPAVAGQTDFKLAWVADAAGSVVDKTTNKSNFYVFAVDAMLPLISATLPFEVGPVAATPDVPKGVVCDATKRFCAVSRGPGYFQAGNIDMFVDEASVVYAASWAQGGWVMPFPAGTKSGACFSSWNPPRAGMPSRLGKFVIQNETAPEWAILDHRIDPCNPKQVMLPAKSPSGQAIVWQAVSDGPWAIGNVANADGTTSPVRVDTRIVDPDPLKNAIVGPVETLPVTGNATDVNDAGTIVGIHQAVATGRIFVWSNGNASYLDEPAGAGCFHVTINSEGSLLAACSTAAGTYAFVRMAGSAAWTQAISTNGGPGPAFFYPGRVNVKGQLVASTFINQQATDIVLWDRGNTYSLLGNTAFDKGQPTQLMYHASVNDKGEIAIFTATDVTGTRNVYLVSPNAAYMP